MRILMASHGYPPTLSGVTLVVQKLARAMVARGHQVTVLTASDRGEPYRDIDGGVEIERVRSLPNPFWKEGRIPVISLRAVREIVERVGPDVIHIHETGCLGWQLTRLSRREGIPIVATCHYLPRFVAFYLVNARPLCWILSLYSAWLLNRCTHVVFATETHHRAFQEFGLAAPTTIISNGVNTARYHPARGGEKDVEAAYRLPPRPRILFVGRLARDKEIPTLIQAVAHLRNKMDAHLLLVGRGDFRPQLEALSAELGLKDRVHFLGYVPDQDMPALYRAVDLFAIASTVEVQSLPTLEAMASSVPVVAVEAGALPEISPHKASGLIVPPRDPAAMAEAMYTILSNPSLGEQMGRRGRELAEPHDEERTFDAYEALYRRVVGQPLVHKAPLWRRIWPSPLAR